MADHEHPLLMKGPLVRATLEGRKTQTRRLVTPRNSTIDSMDLQALGAKSVKAAWSMLDWSGASATGMWWAVPPRQVTRLCSEVLVRPRVEPGHALWIRESWRTGIALDDEAPSMLASWAAAAGHEPCGPLRYETDGTTVDAHRLGLASHYGHTWGRLRPGIHLPRWACRLVLPVVGVRAVRVQEISEEDALAEGCTGYDPEPADEGGTYYGWPGRSSVPSPLAHFRCLWDEINGHRPGAAWADNPPLWVYEWRPTDG